MKRTCFIILLLLFVGTLIFFIDKYLAWSQVDTRLKKIELMVGKITEQLHPTVVDGTTLLANYPGVPELQRERGKLEVVMLATMYMLFISAIATVVVFRLGKNKRKPVREPIIAEF